ncbi:MAG: hypothetical protein CBB68_13470 [Rhodospirillaceae bacterium TMED8]|nr:hypothetical protein [Magnetovibrio sp.]OUT48570.1 MAG: hypothetical protein CBB68_13470 [Rhodospirillaceae bacterium TMED8]
MRNPILETLLINSLRDLAGKLIVSITWEIAVPAVRWMSYLGLLCSILNKKMLRNYVRGTNTNGESKKFIK